MNNQSARRTIPRRVDRFFRHPGTERVLLYLIALSIIVAGASLVFDYHALEVLNFLFSVLFMAELTVRALSYGDRKREYLADWWMDWIASIPWDAFLFVLFPGGGASMLRLLRLPRIFRLLRFRRLKRSPAARMLSYRFRRLMEISIWRQAMTLLIASLALVWIFSFLLDGLGLRSGHGGNFWFSLITMISSDSIFEVKGQDAVVKGAVVLLSFIGIVLFNGILIAIIIGKLMEYLADTKNGGEVWERGHIILLGWNECIPHMVDELDSYCITERHKPIKVVIMGEETFRPGQEPPSRLHVRVISRTGSFQNEEALDNLSAHKASAVVVLGDGAPDRQLSERLNDPVVTRTLLSLETLLADKGRNGEDGPVIILNYLDLDNSLHVTNFLKPFGQESRRIFFNPLFFTGKLIASMCINPYAEDIFNELLTSEGNEFHISRPPIPPGTKWGDIAGTFPLAVPVGYRNGDEGLRMVPFPEEILPEGAAIVVLSENDWDGALFNSKALAKKETARDGLSLCRPPAAARTGTLVIMGVNPKLPFIIERLEKLARRIVVVDNQTEEEFRDWYEEYSRTPLPEGVYFKDFRFRSEEEVRQAVRVDSADWIIILADGYLLNASTPDRIDAETLSKLLMISSLIEDEGNGEVPLIVETLTVDSEVVIRNIRNCSNVIGPRVTGRLLTTFAIQPEFEPVFRSLVRFGDIDIVCHPVGEVLSGWSEGESVTFGELLALPLRGAIPLGWVAPAKGDGGLRRAAPKVVLNPPKDSPLPEGGEIIFLCREV